MFQEIGLAPGRQCQIVPVLPGRPVPGLVRASKRFAPFDDHPSGIGLAARVVLALSCSFCHRASSSSVSQMWRVHSAAIFAQSSASVLIGSPQQGQR